MARLPQPGGDDNVWGAVLNDFLSTSHNTDGTLKNGVVHSDTLTAGSAVSGQVLSYDGSDLSWATPTGSGSVPDATASVKGLVQLTGDLSGTAGSPTVPGLATKADTSALNAHTTNTSNPHAVTKAQVGLGNVDNTADTAKPVSTAQQTALNLKANIASPTFTGVVTVPTPTNNTDAATKAYVDATASTGTPDANASTKGKLQLAGDLGGTAASPTVPGLASKANTVHTHVATDITSGTIATARLGSGTASTTTYLRGDNTWTTPANSIASATDATITSPVTGEFLAYNTASSKWQNSALTGQAALASTGGQETISTLNATGATTLNLSNGNVFNVTLTGNTTFTFSGATAGKACSFALYKKQDGTGSRTVTWPASVKWSGGAPTLTTTANSIDILVFETLDGGTTWFGSIVGTNFS